MELETRGKLEAGELTTVFERDDERRAFDALVGKRVAFRAESSGTIHALSTLVKDLP